MTLKKSQSVFCFLLSFVLLVTFLWSIYNLVNRISSDIEAKAIYDLDKLSLFCSIISLMFFFGYAHYVLNKVIFLQRSFFYMGWWSFLLIAKEFLELIPNKVTQISLVLLVHLLGLYLVILTFINLRKLLTEAKGERTGTTIKK